MVNVCFREYVIENIIYKTVAILLILDSQGPCFMYNFH